MNYNSLLAKRDWHKCEIRLIYHVFFWLFISVIYYFNYQRLIGSSELVRIFLIKELLVSMTAFYSLSSKKIAQVFANPLGILYLIIWVLLLYVFWGIATYLTCLLFVEGFTGYGPRFGSYLQFVLTGGPFGVVRNVYIFALDFIFLISLPVGPKFVKIMMEHVLARTKLERDNLELELSFLKAQVNSHFLFNTLNNIYQLLAVDFDRGRDMVLRLSALMRYTLHGSKTSHIQLKKEIGFIQDFLALMRIRYDKKVKIDVDIQNVEEPYKIIPLLLIPFVENAFKHGPDKNPENKSIRISIGLEGDIFVLSVRNTAYPAPIGTKSNDINGVGGFGLNNIQRRLDLRYNGKYTLDRQLKDNVYSVDLKVNLKFSE